MRATSNTAPAIRMSARSRTLPPRSAMAAQQRSMVGRVPRTLTCCYARSAGDGPMGPLPGGAFFQQPNACPVANHCATTALDRAVATAP